MVPRSEIHSRILKVLQAHSEGISINDMRRELNLGRSEHQHLDRRVRDLDDEWEIVRRRAGTQTLYQLQGKKANPVVDSGISGSLRSEILWRAHGRCEMCGRTISDDGVKLQIDHKIPRSWGGTSTEENLWALCSHCNRDKRNFFSTITDPRIQQAMTHESVHVRLGELLKAYHPDPVPGKYLELVAHTHDDWQKRLRELRELGWQYRYSRRRDDLGRVRVEFILDHWEPWPADPAHAIRQAEQNKGGRR